MTDSESVQRAKKRKQEEEGQVERTVVLQGYKNLVNFMLPRYAAIKENIDACYDYIGPSVVTAAEPIWQELLKLEKRGIRIRFLTDITKGNISSCKKFLTLKTSELRHLDGVKGNFGIADGRECFEHTISKEGEQPTHGIFTTVKRIVDSRQFLFDNLWNKGIPAEERMKEIEEGMIPDVIEILRDPSEIIKIGYSLVNAARDEILVIFHTANALIRQDKAGGIDLLVESAIKHKTQVKILVPIEDKVRGTIQRLEQVNGIQVRRIEPTMQTRITILAVDRMYSLVIELKDDSKENSEDAIGLATYSNSKSTVLSYVSIFETLWKQSELREELMIRTVAQKDFINIAAHELRNPIQPILGLSDVLHRSEAFFDNSKDNRVKQKEMIDIIARNAKRLHRLTEDILDVTRIEGKTLNLNKNRFVLAKTIREMVQDYETEIKNSNRNITISFSSSEELESTIIAADQSRIKQVLYNLIDNAIKFGNEGAVSITAELDKERGNVIVKVKDTGSGIDSGILPRLFTKFATKSEGGTGLGLYISRGIIEAHGGGIWAKNHSAGNDEDSCGAAGATFSFELPLEDG